MPLLSPRMNTVGEFNIYKYQFFCSPPAPNIGGEETQSPPGLTSDPLRVRQLLHLGRPQDPPGISFRDAARTAVAPLGETPRRCAYGSCSTWGDHGAYKLRGKPTQTAPPKTALHSPHCTHRTALTAPPVGASANSRLGGFRRERSLQERDRARRGFRGRGHGGCGNE